MTERTGVGARRNIAATTLMTRRSQAQGAGWTNIDKRTAESFKGSNFFQLATQIGHCPDPPLRFWILLAYTRRVAWCSRQCVMRKNVYILVGFFVLTSCNSWFGQIYMILASTSCLIPKRSEQRGRFRAGDVKEANSTLSIGQFMGI